MSVQKRDFFEIRNLKGRKALKCVFGVFQDLLNQKDIPRYGFMAAQKEKEKYTKTYLGILFYLSLKGMYSHFGVNF